MEKLRIETLGGVQVQLGGEAVKISRRKALALLVYLAVTGELHSRESLASLLWPETTQARAYANLRQAIWDLNRSLGEDWLQVTRDTVKLTDHDTLWLDIVEFNRLRSLVKTHAHPHGEVCEHCLIHFQQAAELVKGDFMAGFSLRDSLAFDDWQFFQADELRREVGGIYRQLMDWYQEKREYEQAVGYSRRWLLLDELNEDAHRALMRLFAANGQRSAAIRQYEHCAALLKRELGIAPEAATTELFQTIQIGELAAAPLEIEDAPPRISGSKLPVQVTPFIGRVEEIDELARLLRDPDTRLLTILAPGGMGKTRLAIEIAQKLESDFEHGVFYVPLAPLEKPELILNYIADAIGYICCEGKSLNQQLLDYFGDKSILLVLDNFEHLVEKADWFRDLLAAAPNLKILATSRVPLNIQVESRFHLAGLRVPERGASSQVQAFSSVKLFLQSARRAKPMFKPAESDWQQIGEICRLVGGMPLGIEMAAAWLEMLTLSEIAAEIRRGLGFFETEISDVPERQHSLYAVFDYSWKMLSDLERELFPKLSIFRGGFTREAAEKIVGISLRQLVAFTNRSLLIRTPDDRFEIHALLRQYGFEKLQASPDEYEQVKTRFAAYFCEKLDVWYEDLQTGNQNIALMEIDADFENIRSAWEISVWLERLDFLDLALGGLILYLIRRVRYEDGVVLCALAAEHISAESRVGIRLLSWLKGHLLLLNGSLGRRDEIEPLYQECISLIERLEPLESREDRLAKAFHLYVKGMFFENQGDYPAAYQTMFDQAFHLFQELGEDWWCAVIYRYIAIASWIEVDLNSAYGYFQEALKISRNLDDHYGLAVTLERLGWFSAYGHGDLEKAQNYLEEGSKIFLALGDPNSYRRHIYCLEQIANIYGRFDEVLQLRHKHLQVLENLGDRSAIAELYMLFGEAYHHVGDYAIAEIKGRRGYEYLIERGSRYYQAWSRWFLGLTLVAQEDYEQANALLMQSVDINRETTNKAHLAGSLAALVRVEIAKGNLHEAHTLLEEGLAEGLQASEPFMMLYLLASASLLLAHRGNHTQALETYSLVHSWEFAANSCWFSDVYQKPLLLLTGAAEIPIKERQPKAVLWQTAESLLAVAQQG